MRPKSLKLLAVLMTLGPAAGLTQQSPPPVPAAHDVPRPDQIEPGVNTSAPPAPDQPMSQSTDSPAKDATAASAPQPAAPGKAAPADARKDAAAKTPAKKAAPDRLQLDATDITGNRELPKVLYIVPWKRSDLGDLVGKPPNSLLDEVLQPVDRDVFKRENRYYDALKSDPESAAPPAAQGAEKNP
jgi:hypothetical protein